MKPTGNYSWLYSYVCTSQFNQTVIISVQNICQQETEALPNTGLNKSVFVKVWIHKIVNTKLRQTSGSVDSATKKYSRSLCSSFHITTGMLLYSMDDCFMIIKTLSGETGAKISSFTGSGNKLFLGKNMFKNFSKILQVIFCLIHPSEF